MTYVRATGIILAAVSVFGLGLIRAASAKREYVSARSMLRLLMFIRIQIEGFSMPLDRIYSRFDDPVLSRVGFIALLRERGLTAALIECREKIGLSAAVNELLLSFADGLGKTPRAEQLEHCASYISSLETEIAAAAAALPARRRMCLTLGGAAALMLVILFI